MKNTIQILAGILAVQVILTIALLSSGSDLSGFKADAPLLSFDASSVDSLLIEGVDDKKIEIAKTGGEWVLPAQENFPADSNKVSEFIDALSALKRPWPVAKTKIAAKQFQVTDEAFEKRVSFKKGSESLATLYLGTSPGFKKVHARVDDETLVFAVPYSAQNVSVVPAQWHDKNILRVEREQAKHINVGGLALVRDEQGDKTWQLSDLKEVEQMVDSEKESVLSSLLTPVFNEVIGSSLNDEQAAGTPVLDYTITFQDGTSRTISYSGPVGEKEEYILKSSDHPFYLKATKVVVDRIKEITREKLVEEKKVAEVVMEEEVTEEPLEVPAASS